MVNILCSRFIIFGKIFFGEERTKKLIGLKKKYDFNFFVLAHPAKIRKESRADSLPDPSSARTKSEFPPKKLVEVLRILSPENCFANPSPFYRTAHFLPFEPFGDVAFPALSILESSVLCTEAHSARGTPLITDFENRF